MQEPRESAENVKRRQEIMDGQKRLNDAGTAPRKEGNQRNKFNKIWRPREGFEFNPWRSIPRNDPCPCGSGKKFKKCCLPRCPLAVEKDVAAELRKEMVQL